MTTGVDGQPRAAAQVRLAEQVRVAVIFAGQQTDVTLPANSTVAAVVEALIPLLQTHRESIGLDQAKTTGLVSLTRINGETLDRSQTLAQQGVLDGELLVLEFTDTEVAFTPIVENASSAVAIANAQRFSAVTARTAVAMACATAAVGTVITTLLLANAWRLNLAAGDDANLLPAVIAAGLAAVLLLAGSLVWWRRREELVAPSLWLITLIPAIAAAVMATPGHPGAPHILFAGVIAATLALVLWRVAHVPRGLISAVFFIGAGVAGAALVRLLWAVRIDYLMVGVLVVALVVLTKAAGLSARIAGIPLPPFPTVTGKFVFDKADDIAAEALAAAEHSGTPSVAALIDGAAAANTYLTALVASVAVFFVGGSVLLVDPDASRWWLQTIFVGVLAAVLVLRGRAFTDRTQSIIVVAAALSMVAGVAVKFALTASTVTMTLAVASGVFGLGVLALLIAAVVPSRAFTPTFRKAVEYLEYALIVAVFPLALWLLNLYHYARFH